MNKENFLEILKNSTPQELNRIIEEKGKEPKKIKVIIFDTSSQSNKKVTK